MNFKKLCNELKGNFLDELKMSLGYKVHYLVNSYSKVPKIPACSNKRQVGIFYPNGKTWTGIFFSKRIICVARISGTSDSK